ncbi:MAG: sigma-54-dependent Fis family transcriptional regulator [Gemmatimonadetes bacterium]|nr:sigma-54-dependent Fis family transcriptional regulator [Gemmatimonadota bacterium]
MASEIRVLLADDNVEFARILSAQLRKRGFRVDVAYEGREALRRLQEDEFDVAVLDLILPDLDGIAVLREIRQADAPPEVIMLTGNATVETAVAAVKLGAEDYVPKPCRPEELEIKIRKAYEARLLRRENTRLQARLSRHEIFPEIVTAGGMHRVLELVRKIAPTDNPVLVTGESGVGKELVARGIHRLSQRGAAPLVDINCAAIQDTLLESELFGHERGAFTGATTRKLGLFELADGGTVLMDEIVELVPRLQAKLLRALEMGAFFRVGGTRQVQVNIRLIAATNRDIDRAVRDGAFREDLYYRVSTFRVHVPLLRERPEDIAVLAQHFLSNARPDAPKLSEEAIVALQRYPWPGNVRELKNIMERAAILASGPILSPEDLPADLEAGPLRPAAEPQPIGEPVPLDDVEREHIAAVLARTGWHQGKAAAILGISPKTLYRKIREYGLKRP